MSGIPISQLIRMAAEGDEAATDIIVRAMLPPAVRERIPPTLNAVEANVSCSLDGRERLVVRAVPSREGDAVVVPFGDWGSARYDEERGRYVLTGTFPALGLARWNA